MNLKNYQQLIDAWSQSTDTYTKRAAFTLIASILIHDKNLKEEDVDDYLQLIKENSTDEREHVKKAVS